MKTFSFKMEIISTKMTLEIPLKSSKIVNIPNHLCKIIPITEIIILKRVTIVRNQIRLRDLKICSDIFDTRVIIS